jgi:hypothetical protein
MQESSARREQPSDKGNQFKHWILVVAIRDTAVTGLR